MSDFSPGRASRARGNDFEMHKYSARLGIVFGAPREVRFLTKHKEFKWFWSFWGIRFGFVPGSVWGTFRGTFLDPKILPGALRAP